MADVAGLLQKQIGQLFSAQGVGGVSLQTTAMIEICEAGGFDPGTAKPTTGKFLNWSSGEYTDDQPPKISVIPRTRRNQQVPEVTVQDSLVLLTEPNDKISPQLLIGKKLHCMGRQYNVSECSPTYFGGMEVIWEIVCQ